MNWDIYGNALQEGFCEVHPNVGEYWPCYYCRAEQEPEPQQPEPQRWNSEDYRFNLVRDAVGEDFDDLDDEPTWVASPPTPLAWEQLRVGDGTSEPCDAPEPARHITTIAGQRVPLIDPYGDIFSWDAP